MERSKYFQEDFTQELVCRIEEGVKIMKELEFTVKTHERLISMKNFEIDKLKCEIKKLKKGAKVEKQSKK